MHRNLLNPGRRHEVFGPRRGEVPLSMPAVAWSRHRGTTPDCNYPLIVTADRRSSSSSFDTAWRGSNSSGSLARCALGRVCLTWHCTAAVAEVSEPLVILGEPDILSRFPESRTKGVALGMTVVHDSTSCSIPVRTHSGFQPKTLGSLVSMSMRLRIVQQGSQQVSGRARIRRPLRLATRLTRGRQLARTLHRYVAQSLETADPLGLNEREFARDLDLPDR